MLAGAAPTTAVPLGGLVAVGLIGHAMFVRCPVDIVPQNAGPEPVRDAPFNSAD